MRSQFSVEFVYQVFALIVATLIVHAIYVTVIRPSAEAELLEQNIQLQEDPTYVPDRSIVVLIRDYEQEACFILMLWALAIMGFKTRGLLQERRLLQEDLMGLSTGESILPEDTREYARPLEALPQERRDSLLPQALLTALDRFRATRNIQDAATAVREVCETESERLDSELSMVRYIAWAIPSIGFLGTVRGIGQALSQAHRAVEGDIAGVTESLGIAFNSTFIALLLSIVLMFLVHQMQLLQERLVLDTQHYCDRRLMSHLRTL